MTIILGYNSSNSFGASSLMARSISQTVFMHEAPYSTDTVPLGFRRGLMRKALWDVRVSIWVVNSSRWSLWRLRSSCLCKG
jgi:hypothetical protein